MVSFYELTLLLTCNLEILSSTQEWVSDSVGSIVGELSVGGGVEGAGGSSVSKVTKEVSPP